VFSRNTLKKPKGKGEGSSARTQNILLLTLKIFYTSKPLKS
jgi:hypothetical protein